jgi:hypothetical protein
MLSLRRMTTLIWVKAPVMRRDQERGNACLLELRNTPRGIERTRETGNILSKGEYDVGTGNVGGEGPRYADREP